MVEEHHFEEGMDYKDVYFMVVDTKGHSKVVQYNDSDKVDKAFDEFEEIVYRSVDDMTKQNRCEIAQNWGWQGDGGLFVFFDRNESVARKTAISSSKAILGDIPFLNNRLKRINVSGEIHVRIALHKGSLRYKRARGSIHSRELNLTSHVEKVVPPDTVAISKDIYDISGNLQSEFIEAESAFESMKFYLYSYRSRNEILQEWRRNLAASGEHFVPGVESDVPFEELGLSGVFSQRALTSQYVKLIYDASKCIWALGIGLGGFQSDHRERVLLPKALKGVDIRLLVADPNMTVKLQNEEYSLPSWRDYAEGGGDYNERSQSDLAQMVHRINNVIKKDVSPEKAYVKLKYYNTIPTIAMLMVDSTIYFSPYFVRQSGLKSLTFKFTSESRLYDQCVRHFLSIWDEDRYSRVPLDVFQGE